MKAELEREHEEVRRRKEGDNCAPPTLTGQLGEEISNSRSHFIQGMKKNIEVKNIICRRNWNCAFLGSRLQCRGSEPATA